MEEREYCNTVQSCENKKKVENRKQNAGTPTKHTKRFKHTALSENYSDVFAYVLKINLLMDAFFEYSCQSKRFFGTKIPVCRALRRPATAINISSQLP